MCVSKVQHMTGRKTGFFRFFDFSTNVATGNRKNSEFVQLQPVVRSLQLGSVRFRSFFQSSELDLRTLLVEYHKKLYHHQTYICGGITLLVYWNTFAEWMWFWQTIIFFAIYVEAMCSGWSGRVPLKNYITSDIYMQMETLLVYLSTISEDMCQTYSDRPSSSFAMFAEAMCSGWSGGAS